MVGGNATLNLRLYRQPRGLLSAVSLVCAFSKVPQSRVAEDGRRCRVNGRLQEVRDIYEIVFFLKVVLRFFLAFVTNIMNKDRSPITPGNGAPDKEGEGKTVKTW